MWHTNSLYQEPDCQISGWLEETFKSNYLKIFTVHSSSLNLTINGQSWIPCSTVPSSKAYHADGLWTPKLLLLGVSLLTLCEWQWTLDFAIKVYRGRWRAGCIWRVLEAVFCMVVKRGPWKKENERKLANTENRMISKMCRLREGIPVEKMRQEMGVMAISDAVKLDRLRWFGHVKRGGKLGKEMYRYGDWG